MAGFPFRTLLVPTDFSICADDALSLADRIAQAGGASARIILMHASELPAGMSAQTQVQPEPDRPAVAMGELMHLSATRRMQQQRDRLGIRSPVELRVCLSSPLKAILDEVLASSVDAIVMGTHGRTGLDRLLLGSVAEHVVRAASVPVITVRGGCPTDAPEDRTEAEQIALDEASG